LQHKEAICTHDKYLEWGLLVVLLPGSVVVRSQIKTLPNDPVIWYRTWLLGPGCIVQEMCGDTCANAI
jgi:hypothetical protein